MEETNFKDFGMALMVDSAVKLQGDLIAMVRDCESKNITSIDISDINKMILNSALYCLGDKKSLLNMMREGVTNEVSN